MDQVCQNCKHYRYTRSTLRRVTIGLCSETFGKPAKHECLFMPNPVKVSPNHSCGQFKSDQDSNASVSSSGDEPEYASRDCWVCVCGTKVRGGIKGICSKCGADWYYQRSKPNADLEPARKEG